MSLLSPLENFLNIPSDTVRSEIQQDFNESEFRHNTDYSTQKAQENYAFQARNGMAMQVQGAKNAGVSPLAALGQSASFTPTAAAAKGVDMSAKTTGGDSLSDLSVLGASIKNLLAQANKSEAEATKVEIENKRLEDEDATIQANLQRYFASLEEKYKNEPEKLEALKTLGSSDMSASYGSLQGMREFSKLSAELPQNERDIAEAKFEKLLYKEMVNNEAFKDKANMPRLEFEKMAQDIFKTAQEVVNLRLQALNIAQDTSTKKSQEDLNYASIEKLAQEVIHLYHGDWAAMWKNSDYSAMFIRLAAESTKAAAAGAGFAVGGRVGAIGKGARRALHRPKTLDLPDVKKGYSSNGRKALNESQAKNWAAKRQKALNSPLNPF